MIVSYITRSLYCPWTFTVTTQTVEFFLTDARALIVNMKSPRIPCVHSCCQRGVAPQRPRLRPPRCQGAEKSSFSDASLSSRASKGLVAGLTALVNGVAGNQTAPRKIERQEPAAAVWKPGEVLEGTDSASNFLFIAPGAWPFSSTLAELIDVHDCCRCSQRLHREQLFMDR